MQGDSSTLIGSWELDRFSVSARFFEFSRAYLEASLALCSRLGRLHGNRFPQATVVLFLARHSVELFLKGAIVSRLPNVDAYHDLEKLKKKYDELYPEKEFAWTLPFRTEYSGLTPQQIEKVKKHLPPDDQVCRYPVAKLGKEWSGGFALSAGAFKRELLQLRKDMSNLTRTICAAVKRRKVATPS